MRTRGYPPWLKKTELAGHFRSQCIDCGQFSSKDTVQTHTQFISEAEEDPHAARCFAPQLPPCEIDNLITLGERLTVSQNWHSRGTTITKNQQFYSCFVYCVFLLYFSLSTRDCPRRRKVLLGSLGESKVVRRPPPPILLIQFISFREDAGSSSGTRCVTVQLYLPLRHAGIKHVLSPLSKFISNSIV